MPKKLICKPVAERLLVVSENQELCLFLQSEVNKHFFDHPLLIDFCYTSFNKNPQQMIEIGATRINVKDETTVDQIIDLYDLVLSLHCKQIFPRRLVENVCCINFHPGFNPYNRGWFSQAFSIINGLPIGATIHLMDAEVDHGKIVAQRMVSIEPSDTSLEVYRKVIDAEKDLIKQNIFNIIEGKYETFAAPGEGNFNSKEDYASLCALDLDSVGTLKNHINLLRATTHGEFRNAFFVGEDGQRYYVKISIEST